MLLNRSDDDHVARFVVQRWSREVFSIQRIERTNRADHFQLLKYRNIGLAPVLGTLFHVIR